MIDGEDPHLVRREIALAVIREVRRDAGVPALRERRRPEPGADGAAEGQSGGRLPTERQLSGQPLTEVAVALETGRDVDQEIPGKLALQVGIDAKVGPLV